MGDISSARDHRRRRRILFLNGAAIAGCTILMWFTESGVLSPVSPRIHLLYWIPLVLLVAGEWLAWREQYLTAALAMFLGGIGTLPIGLLAIIGALASRRLGRRPDSQDPLQVPCTKCGYDLRGAPVPRCPECGCLRGFDKTAEELGIDEATRLTDSQKR